MEEALKPMLTALVPLVVALAGYLTKKLVEHLNAKTGAIKDEALQRAIVDASETAVRSVMQTYVKGAKTLSVDGHLSDNAREEAFKRTKETATQLLAARGTKDVQAVVMNAAIEAAVGKVKNENAAAALGFLAALGKAATK